MSHRRAFTLIELLVVIAIIAILAAILFPVFAQAKLAAKKSVDLSNQKQIALGAIMYTNDFDDMYPLNHNCQSGNLWQSWRETTAPYIKSGNIVRTDGTNWVEYGIHSTPASPSPRAYGAHQRLFAQPCNYAASTSVNTTQLAHPTRTLMTTTQGVVPAWNYNPANDGIWDAFWMYADWSQWPPLYTGNASVPCDKDSDTWPCAWVPRYRYAEGEGLNVAWADGHGKYVKKGALNWCLNIAMPEVGTDGQGGDNTTLFNAGGFCSRYSND